MKKGVILLTENDIAFNYFLGEESELFTFIKVPKLFFTDKRFSKLSYGAKILYGLLLDRMSLSRKNKWMDEKRRIYVIYTIESIKEDFSISKTVAVKFMKELEDFGLIERKKRPNAAALIYVKNFVMQEEQEVEKIAQNQGSPKYGSPEVQNMEVQNMEFQKIAQNQGSPKYGSPNNGSPEVQNMESNKTNINKTLNNILSSSSVEKNMRMMIKEKINYDEQIKNSEEQLVDEVVQCLVNIFVKQKNENRERLLLENLTEENFRIILNNIKTNGIETIYNFSNYILACFCNVKTINKSNTNVVNQNKYDFEKLEELLLANE